MDLHSNLLVASEKSSVEENQLERDESSVRGSNGAARFHRPSLSTLSATAAKTSAGGVCCCCCNMARDRRRLCKRLAIDIFLSFTALVFVACSYFGVLLPQPRGFFCNDQTIRYAYKGDTISLRSILFICLVVPILFIALAETWLHNVASSCTTTKETGFRLCFRRFGRISLDYVLGLMFAAFLVEMLKVMVGELRPHFLDTCRPNISANCTDEFVARYRCQSSYQKNIVLDTFKSFPSGHAVISLYAAVFLIVYLQIRVKDRVSRLFCPWIQAVCLTGALYCCVSRITDYRHHWWDVLFGAVLGLFLGLVTVYIIHKHFEETSSTNRTPSSERVASDGISSQLLLSSSQSDHKDVNMKTMNEMATNHA